MYLSFNKKLPACPLHVWTSSYSNLQGVGELLLLHSLVSIWSCQCSRLGQHYWCGMEPHSSFNWHFSDGIWNGKFFYVPFSICFIFGALSSVRYLVRSSREILEIINTIFKFIYICMPVLRLSICLCTMYLTSDIRYPGTGVTDSSESRCGCQGSNLSPLEEQAEPTLQSPGTF